MTDETALAKRNLAHRVLEAYQFEYQDFSAWWNDLERKAQGTVAIAGIILGGAFAFVRQLDTMTQPWEKIALSALVISLLLSVGLAILALFLREFDLPPGADSVEELAREIMAAPDNEIPDRVIGMIYDEAPVWRDCTASLYSACRSKARFLMSSQIALGAAAVLITVVTIGEIFG